MKAPRSFPNRLPSASPPVGVALAFGLAVALSTLPASANPVDRPPVADSAAVFAHLETFRSELDAIRFVMGRPESSGPEIEVRGAAPREVYFQALTLFRKSARLLFELTRREAPEPDSPPGPIDSRDVYRLIDAALDCLASIRADLGITAEGARRLAEPDRTSTDVFRAAIHANRQLNTLLEQRYSPADVFQAVTHAVGYASRLLETFPAAETFPEEPALELGRRPADVYLRLLDCLELLRRIGGRSGIAIMEVEVRGDPEIEPSDVYDIASVVVAELAHLHSLRSTAEPPPPRYHPGRKFPSHVHQRAGLLERQLQELERQVGRDPGWLTVSEADGP